MHIVRGVKSKLLTAIALMAAIHGASSADIVRLGTKVEWPPYHIDAPDGADGVAVRVVACVMARINQPFEIHKKPWKRVQYETSKGQLDGFFAASNNKERDKYASLTATFIPQQRVFYTKKSSINIPLAAYTLDYIRTNVKVAARAGSNALYSLQQEKFDVIVTPQTQEQLLHALDQGRVGAILENALVFEALLAKTGKSMAEYYPVVHKQKDMGVYFGHHFLSKHPDFLAKFNRNIAPCLQGAVD